MKVVVVVRVVLAAWFALQLAACGGASSNEEIVEETVVEIAENSTTETGQVESSVEASSFYNEAPMLAELVATGELPPVDERLPQNPMLLQPVERVGNYGGSWRLAMSGNRDHALLIRILGYENLVRWTPEWTGIVPNIAQSFEANDEATEYTFHLRKGMRWSDGEPFTADDIMFWYEAVFSHPAFSDVLFPWLTVGGEPVVVEKLDEVTVQFRFSQPNGLFLRQLAHPHGAELTNYPRHYLAQFHVDYNPDVETLVQEAGVSDWVELFQTKVGLISEVSIDTPTRWSNPELPTLNPWLLVNGYNSESTELQAVRNPYYWKVDPAFNQLPYIDNLEYTVAPDAQAVLELILAGQIDAQSRHVQSIIKPGMLQESGLADSYHFYTLISSLSNTEAILFNQTYPDPAVREVLQNRDFRIGLSHAINRQAIIDEVYGGEGEPFQVAPKAESSFYNEEFAKQYTEYDIDLANTYLDQAGYSSKDSEGFRLDGTGNRIVLVVDYSTDVDSNTEAIMTRVQADWRTVGVEIQLNLLDRNSFNERYIRNEHQISVWLSSDGLAVVQDPRYYFPFSQDSIFAPGWSRWYSDPTHPLAEEPSAAAQQQMALYDQIIGTGDELKQAELMTEILEIAAEEFYAIGISTPGNLRGVVSNNFQNVPSIMPFSWTYPHPAPTNPAQYFIETK